MTLCPPAHTHVKIFFKNFFEKFYFEMCVMYICTFVMYICTFVMYISYVYFMYISCAKCLMTKTCKNDNLFKNSYVNIR